MPIPDLNGDGLLPEGIHDCTLVEIGVRFGRFGASDRRVRLFEQLRALVEEERQAGVAVEFIVDGSFVTAKPEPGDIDLVIILPAHYNPSPEMPPFLYNALSKAVLRRRYRFDVFVLSEDDPDRQAKLDFFQQVKEGGGRKGILRIKL